MSQEYRVVPAVLLESALKTLAVLAPGRFAVETELRAIVDAPVTPDAVEVESVSDLLRAHSLGEFSNESGSETVEAMSCKSYDDFGQNHEFESYGFGYQQAMYEQGALLLALISRVQIENAQLQQYRTSYMDWHEKTESLLQGFEAGELGRHRADVLRSRFHKLQAENAALQQRLNVADQRIDDLEQDKARLDSLEANYWDVRHHSTPIADTGDHSTSVEIIGHWMDRPHARVIGENYNENLRAAIDQAMTADAYPPARPEYPELDATLAEEDWHMNPCKQGHRDVGACQGKAFCHTCDEKITATSTQEAFEQWNASHPAAK
ncbi:hypothetical protein NPS29_16775 [Pseudomonas putida]|uniref:hypothetical protein n=1 Tax=Pseudomonas putida TaxID=303 RepID=UPI0023642EB5|nr:hypothetical protein [Pseudomonas putida]MDD1966985.1 hypothetical protein [Pseudomonas putida]